MKIFADDGAVLDSLGPLVAAEVDSVAGVVDVKDGVVPAGDALVIRVDRERAALEGVDPDDVSRQLQAYIGGRVTTTVQRGERVIGVRTWIPGSARRSSGDVGRLTLRALDGHRFRASRIVDIEEVSGQPEIVREDLKRMVSVTGRLEGRDLGSVMRDVRTRLDRPGLLPAGVYYELGGTYAQQQAAFRGLLGVFVAAILLVFLLLLFLYERLLVAGAMVCTTLLAFPAVSIGLWLTGTELNIASMMGLTMIVGIITEVSIFYFSELQELAPRLGSPLPLVEAGRNRARPIAMTTAAAILALLPLALGLGQGSGMLQPLAISIVSGLLVQLPLVLLVLPVLLSTVMKDPMAVSRER